MAARERGFRLAHLSDLHIGPLPRVRPGTLLGKRALGYLSWHLRKQRVHRPEVLAALRQDLLAIAPDHIAITGDLINLALPAEFVQAADWLRELGPSERVSVVPGNHEAYAAVSCTESLAHWAAYMSSDEDAASLEHRVAFPYLRRRGPFALIGLSTASVSPPGFATGRLGAVQLQALDRLLAGLTGADYYRILLLHHPPRESSSAWRKRLIDAAAFRRIVAERGAELILHGHEHLPSHGALEGQDGPMPVIGVPSASSLDSRPERRAQYQIHTIARGANGWHRHSQTRRYDPATLSFTAPLP
jgi:3',5'-cyclic AMP phosphodiesterase CpdA